MRTVGRVRPVRRVFARVPPRELFPPVFLKLQEQDLLEPVAPRARVANPTYRISQNGDRRWHETRQISRSKAANARCRRQISECLGAGSSRRRVSIKADRPLTAFCAWRARWPKISRLRLSPPASR